MKISQKLTISAVAIVAIMASFVFPASAQVGFDAYAQTRTIVLESPRILTASGPAFTNANPVDLVGFEGIAKVDISSCTNAGGALTAQLFTSPDKTNLTALANYSLAQQANVLYTNRAYSTTIIGTNTYNQAGVATQPTAATAGFATPYLDNSSPFTNSGAITITTKNVYTVGFNAQDVAGRYLYIVWTPTGSSSNDIVSATITARRQQYP